MVALREAQRAENMIKYKDEIKSRPKSEWIHNKEQKQEIKKQSKKELSSIKDKFGDSN